MLGTGPALFGFRVLLPQWVTLPVVGDSSFIARQGPVLILKSVVVGTSAPTCAQSGIE
jgi:hypothetical protein